jgi:hypothetical protein
MRTFPYKPLRRPDNLVKEVNEQDYCQHEWKWFKERIPVTDDGKDLPGGHTRNYNHARQFCLKIRACVKCEKKVRSDLYFETL